MNDNDLIYCIALELIPKIGSVNAKKLVAYFGSAEGAFKASRRELEQVPGIGLATAHEVANQQVLPQAEAEIKVMERYGIKALYYTDPQYPERLRQCDDGPLVLFVRGNNVDFNTNRVISVVGTRKATAYGVEVCRTLIADLAKHGHKPMVVSGLAYGIDIAAHRAALQHGMPTVGVLAHGLDKVYPAAHKTTAQEMIANGALVSDFTSAAEFDRKHFLKRNRIIAGMADATIVVESASKGGALVTAEIANSYNRDVFAVPGNVGAPYSKGCLDLIKTHRAAMIENAEDLERALNWDVSKPTQPKLPLINIDELNETEQKIMQHLQQKGEDSLDFIAIQTGLAVSTVLPALLNLEFCGLVASKPGKMFKIA